MTIVKQPVPVSRVVGSKEDDPKRGYKIYDPTTVKYKERDDFMKSIEGLYSGHPTPIEDAIILKLQTALYSQRTKTQVFASPQTAELATDYAKYRAANARLPSFTKWASGMFKDNKDLAKDLAAAGQFMVNKDIVISSDVVDILRMADGKHFISCFAYGSMEQRRPKDIAEECAGMSMAYINDEEGYMQGRVILHHARRLDNGKDVILYYCKRGGALGDGQISSLLTSLGIENYKSVSSYQSSTARGIEVEFVNCYPEQRYHDVQAWGKCFVGATSKANMVGGVEEFR